MARHWTDEEIQTIEAVAKRIRDLRGMQGMSRADLAERAGMSVQGIERIEIEGGTNMHITTLVAIARALSVEPGALLSKLPTKTY